MTLEEMLIAVNKNLDKFRAAGDIKAFKATKAMKSEILKKWVWIMPVFGSMKRLPKNTLNFSRKSRKV